MCYSHTFKTYHTKNTPLLRKLIYADFSTSGTKIYFLFHVKKCGVKGGFSFGPVRTAFFTNTNKVCSFTESVFWPCDMHKRLDR